MDRRSPTPPFPHAHTYLSPQNMSRVLRSGTRKQLPNARHERFRRSLPCRRSSRGAGTRDEPLRTSAGEAMEYALRTACTLCCVFFRLASSLRTDVFNVLIFLPWKFAFCLGNRMILSFASSLRSLSRLVVRARLLFFIIYSKRVFCLVEWQNKIIKSLLP